MLKIVKVSRRHFDEVYNRVPPQNRRVIEEITVTNLYLQALNVLLVAEDDVDLFEYPSHLDITIAGIMKNCYEQQAQRREGK